MSGPKTVSLHRIKEKLSLDRFAYRFVNIDVERTCGTVIIKLYGQDEMNVPKTVFINIPTERLGDEYDKEFSYLERPGHI